MVEITDGNDVDVIRITHGGEDGLDAGALGGVPWRCCCLIFSISSSSCLKQLEMLSTLPFDHDIVPL